MPIDGNKVTGFQFWDAVSRTKTVNAKAREAIVDASDVVLVMRAVRQLKDTMMINVEDD
jgi:hypothetical protein